MWAGVVLLFLLLASLVSLTSAVVVAAFLVALILDVDIVVPLAVGLFLLLVCALMLALGQNSSADVLANWAYYFLAIAIILQLIDLVRSGVDETQRKKRSATPERVNDFETLA